MYWYPCGEKDGLTLDFAVVSGNQLVCQYGGCRCGAFECPGPFSLLLGMDCLAYLYFNCGFCALLVPAGGSELKVTL